MENEQYQRKLSFKSRGAEAMAAVSACDSAGGSTEDACGANVETFSGAESFLVGICPHYWAHIPMTISQVRGLKLIDGINCAVVPKGPQNNSKTVPVSKCLLVGYIINAEMRSNGSMSYVLDDGTGLVDCVAWKTEDDIYYLPSLFDDSQTTFKFKIGGLVRIFGKIQCISISTEKESIAVAQRTLVFRDCIREIQITDIEHVESKSSQNVTLGAEARHWTACSKSVLSATGPRLKNAADFLQILGSEIQRQVEDRRNLPAAGDTLAAWRVFGASCRCCLEYKESLLYCHCQAKIEPLDPELTFRDALVEVLLEMQRKHDKKLSFNYREVAGNKIVQEIATKQVAGTAKPRINFDRLFLNTFRALRNDGIIFLTNSDTDTYLLVSRDRVLEPYVRDDIERSRANGMPVSRHFVNFDAAPFLSKVHHERLLYIRRCLSQTNENRNRSD